MNVDLSHNDLIFIRGGLLQAISRNAAVQKNHPKHIAASIAMRGTTDYESILRNKIEPAIAAAEKEENDDLHRNKD